LTWNVSAISNRKFGLNGCDMPCDVSCVCPVLPDKKGDSFFSLLSSKPTRREFWFLVYNLSHALVFSPSQGGDYKTKNHLFKKFFERQKFIDHYLYI